MTGRPATGPGRAAAGWPSWTCRRPRGRSSPIAWRSPAALTVLTGRLDGELHQHARTDPRVKTLRTLPGIGEFTALVMVAEIGDISRFGSARQLASWAGLTPTVRGSDLKVRHGNISKQGSVWLRWVLNQAAQTAKRSPEFATAYSSIAKRRGKKIATIAIARKLLTRAWYLLSDLQAADASTPPRRP
jgi:transposase